MSVDSAQEVLYLREWEKDYGVGLDVYRRIDVEPGDVITYSRYETNQSGGVIRY